LLPSAEGCQIAEAAAERHVHAGGGAG
jgi:hypothetical protein